MSVIYIDEKNNPLKSPIYRRFLEWTREEKYRKEEREIYYSKKKQYTYTISCEYLKSNISNRGEYLVLTKFRKKIKKENLKLALSILSDIMNSENDYYIGGDIKGNYIDGKINSNSEIEIICAGITTDEEGITDAGLALINQILSFSVVFQNS